LPSGFLGVDVFMVVSGFIVTNLLMRERDSTGRIRLGAFWGRRFRRLVPALMLLLVVVTCWVHVTGPDTLIPAVRSQGLSALFYATNWKLIASGVTYGGMLAANSPFVHLWSLAVEEQFYLCWPLLLVGVLALARGRRGPVIACTTLATLASAAWMAWLYVPGGDPSRVYYGTDTRAQAFLAGAVAALVAPLLGPALRRGCRRSARSRSWRWSWQCEPMRPTCSTAAGSCSWRSVPRARRLRRRCVDPCSSRSIAASCAASAACRTACTSGTGLRSCCSRRRVLVSTVWRSRRYGSV
jgi:peptidoglycan/LPS O-acetylase OafA/YrhL